MNYTLLNGENSSYPNFNVFYPPSIMKDIKTLRDNEVPMQNLRN